REWLAGQRLKHPNLVEVLDAGETEDGYLWLAMEFLEGETLDQRLSLRGPLSGMQLLSLMGPVCEALQYAHFQGVIHRDIKPENIFLANGPNKKIIPK